MVLELLCCVLFAERCDFIKVHLQVVSHLLRKFIFRSSLLRSKLQEARHRGRHFLPREADRTICCSCLWPGSLQQLAEETIPGLRLALIHEGTGGSASHLNLEKDRSQDPGKHYWIQKRTDTY